MSNSITSHYNMGFYDNLLQAFHDNASWLLPVYILLVIYFVKTMFWPTKEAFNPTQTILMTDSDQWGLSAQRERLAQGHPVGPQQGSLGWQVLNSPDYNCSGRQPVTDDAWAWQMGVVSSPVEGMKPNTDNDFSKIMAGVSN